MGKKENRPTLFRYNREKQLNFPSPERRTRKNNNNVKIELYNMLLQIGPF
ncbi:unnamed protein product [Acanthoscelides obtectus]|uniref:Uncharacterized protein n=1 Tax=Acanthoscelides obtectus TaxID=200917 RepID=A0A9P0QD70_ACAOB|nr:unnamed protein product [Acanthoscelides obtectus]CAK1687892.1 hypothetical protein AOBTE_LOCUS36438 [Acanthoscelides obtectus]